MAFMVSSMYAKTGLLGLSSKVVLSVCWVLSSVVSTELSPQAQSVNNNSKISNADNIHFIIKSPVCLILNFIISKLYEEINRTQTSVLQSANLSSKKESFALFYFALYCEIIDVHISKKIAFAFPLSKTGHRKRTIRGE